LTQSLEECYSARNGGGIILGHKNLEHSVEALESFMNLWKKFHDILESANKNHQVTDELEQQFLEIKTTLAHAQARLTEELDLGSHFTDEVMGILSQIISIKDFISMSTTQIKRIEAQWHNLFILMHGQLGKMEIAIDSKNKKNWFIRFVTNPWFILITVVCILLAVYSLVGHKAAE